jgi:hypothetical protein
VLLTLTILSFGARRSWSLVGSDDSLGQFVNGADSDSLIQSLHITVACLRQFASQASFLYSFPAELMVGPALPEPALLRD